MKKLCIGKKRNINSGSYDNMIASEGRFVKENCGSDCCRNIPGRSLLFAEGHAVGALIHGGIHLMGTNHDLIQGAVVLVITMVGALLDSTFDALVCMTVHRKASFDLTSPIVWTQRRELCWEFSPLLHFAVSCGIL